MLKAGTIVSTEAGAKKGFYCIVTKVLYPEASSLPTMLQMVKEKKLFKRQTQKAKSVQHQILQMWEQYEQELLSVNGLLKRVASIYNSVW